MLNKATMPGKKHSAGSTGNSAGSGRPPNRLIHEKSPYLLQHARNPVDWYPWSNEAFARAAAEDKPVFLSIGYATCHWCHVMARESFEDEDVAEVLNRDFVCIKLDREERPDIDSVYMAICQMMTGRGGWPLTIVMTPDRKPFFAATYIPKTNRFGMKGIIGVLGELIGLWKERRSEIIESSEEILSHLTSSQETCAPSDPRPSLLTEGYEDLALRFDESYGGFGKAPKFPTPHTILFLLRFWKRTGKARALRMAEKTLFAIMQGAIHDHIGGGYHRYSTDARWQVPHFEKMLYDQALLLMAFTEAYQATGKPEYREAAEDIISYVFRDLTSPEGAFYSAEDADSEGGEGAFYLWTIPELEELLGPDDTKIASAVFSVRTDGNFSDAEPRSRTNILYRTKTVKQLSSQLEIPEPELISRVESIRLKLFEAREHRPRPVRDDKVLTDWNGLFIAALAHASWVFDDAVYRDAAERAAQFVLKGMRTAGGELMHRYRDGETAIPAFGDDYAFLIRALIGLYEATFTITYLEEALALNKHFMDHFRDTNEGGFFGTSDNAEALLLRKREIYDGAIPSCNSVSLENLILLSQLTGDSGLEEKAAVLARAFTVQVRQSPASYAWFLTALDRVLLPSQEIVLVAGSDTKGFGEMIGRLQREYLPSAVILCRLSDTLSIRLGDSAPFTREMSAAGGKATAYVCTGHACAMPVTDPDTMMALVSERNAHNH